MAHDDLPKQMLDRVFHVARLLAGAELRNSHQKRTAEPEDFDREPKQNKKIRGRQSTLQQGQNKDALPRKKHSS
jgi:hypothetical protein